MTKILLGVFGAIVAVSVLGYGYLLIPIQPSATEVQAEVVMPQGAYIPPDGWDSGYVFSDAFFAPNTITVSVGDTIKWVNDDISQHWITAHQVPLGAEAFDSQVVEPGEEWTVSFTVPGEYEYHCSLHPFAAAKIIVTR